MTDRPDPWHDPEDALHRTFQEVELRLTDPKRLNSVKATLDKPVPELVHVLIRALAAQVDAPFAAVTIVDSTHQHFLSTNMGAMPRCELGQSRCQYVIGTGNMVAINNVKEHGFFKRLMKSYVKEQETIAYLGVPLKDVEGDVLGAVCVVDFSPRVWTAEEHYALYETSQMVTKILSERS